MKFIVLYIIAFGISNAVFTQNINHTDLPDNAEKIDSGKFEPTWESLKQYTVPEWFRDAKFGIWAHWGPQCQPEQGDWYARFM